MRGRKPQLVENRKVKVDVMLDKDLNDTLVLLVQKKGVRRSSIVTEALREYLERHKDELNA